jgi:hypothetical protein
MTSIRQLRIKASQIAIFGCKKNFFVVNKLEEFSLPAYLKLKALLAKIFLGFILSAIALWWGGRLDRSDIELSLSSSVRRPLKDFTDRRAAKLAYAMHTLSSREAKPM